MSISNNPDIRWKQRFKNYILAYKQLKSAVDLSNQRILSDLENQGMIQAFEFTHELAWNVMKDYFDYQGGNLITGSRDATREAFSKGLIQNGEVWMEMIKSRNVTSHTYNNNIANQIVEKIRQEYLSQFTLFLNKMTELSTDE